MAKYEGQLDANDAHELITAAYEAGRQSVLTSGYDTGYDVGHDTGMSVRQDTRGFVHGVMAGFEKGTEVRKELVADLRQHQAAKPEQEPELEAG